MSIFKERYHNTKSLMSCAAAALAVVSAGALIQGCSDTPKVDCVNNAENAGARKTGFDAGYTQGMALTKENGKADAYPAGRSRGYNDGYYGSNGYPKGKAIGYQQGLAQGQADALACSDGSIAGSNEGYASGVARGRHDGYADGYQYGIDAGVNVGQYTCGGAGDAASDQNQCKNEGRDAGYAQAKNVDNKDYKAGLVVGDALGYNDGVADGQSRGMADGKAQGQLDGLKDGRADAYVACYNAAYVNGAQDPSGRVAGGKVNGFNDGYYAEFNGHRDNANLFQSSGSRPVAPSFNNGVGGEGDGFHDGVLDARLAYCPNAPFNGADSLYFYGHGSQARAHTGESLSWFVPSNQPGAFLDTFTDTYSPYMSDAQSAQVSATIQQQRAANKATLQH